MKPQFHPPAAPVRLASALLARSVGLWTALDCVARLLPLLLLALPAVAHAEDFTYTTNNGAITITGYTGPGGAVIIPDSISGLPVTRIGDSAFQTNYSLTSITIGDSIAVIGSKAFNSCSGLTNLTIGNNVTGIEGGAFEDCHDPREPCVRFLR